jgi:tRNA(adenine34) deaminase
MLDEMLMGEALKEARKAYEADEVPIGMVIVDRDQQIIARAHNQVEMLRDPTAHAEMIALTQAANHLSCKWLLDCTAYVTIEPCCMCSGALVLARIRRLVVGAAEPKMGGCGSVVDLSRHPALNHRFEVHYGVREPECSSLMKSFFLEKRKRH